MEDKFKERLDNLESKLNRIETILERIEPNCNKMGNHINFVENVYMSWRTPITWFLSKISSSRIISPLIASSSSIESIEYKLENE
jgi:hypothetical protein